MVHFPLHPEPQRHRRVDVPTTEPPKRRNSDERTAPSEHESRDEPADTWIRQHLSQRRTCTEIEDNRTYANKDEKCRSEQFRSVLIPVELFPPNLVVHWFFPSVSLYLKRLMEMWLSILRRCAS